MNIPERVAALRAEMAKRGIDVYMIPSADYHQSEYVGEHFKAREFISGFDGSAGTVVVTKDAAGLWTDGRYFIQAAQQLEGSGIELFKMGEEGVPSTDAYILDVLPEGGTVGFDGRVLAVDEGLELEAGVAAKNGKIAYGEDLLDSIWEDRPALSEAPVWRLTLEQTGASTTQKIGRIRTKMYEYGATHHVVTTLDEISWIFNMRANDVEYTPVVLSYAAIETDAVLLFINKDKLSEEIQTELTEIGVTLKPYNDIYEYVQKLSSDVKLLIDPQRLNYALYKDIPADVTKIEQENPAVIMKAMKNEAEIANTTECHIRDGVACTKFSYWLKKNIGKIPMTEISAADKLEEFRKEQGAFELSFETIAGYAHHGAIVHYAATPETDIPLEPRNMLLLDSGGQYPNGTTDITRTYILGDITEEMKVHYTAVLRSHLDLAMAKFLHGCTGYNLDILARQPMWELDLDFNHGTGHGVGHILSCHEGPTGFRWYIVPAKHETHPIEAGMVLTDEPGIYIEGSHGIRIENELLVKNGTKNGYGQFMEFEPLTLCPYDMDAVIPELLTEKEKKYLNDYHQKVYDTISPYLDADEKEWLKEVTKAI